MQDIQDDEYRGLRCKDCVAFRPRSLLDSGNVLGHCRRNPRHEIVTADDWCLRVKEKSVESKG